MPNFGYIEQQIEPKDWVLGAVSAMPKVVERPDGQWDGFLPVLEIQRYDWGDSMACVSFSFLNAIETLLKKRGQIYNFSDRALAKASGTTANGNSMRKVADTARKFGLVEEGNWPASDTVSWQDFYKPLSSSVVSSASMFAQGHNVQYEVVYNYADQMCQALQYSPLQVAMYAYGEVVNGIYQNPGFKPSNHCVMLYSYEYGKFWKVYDHYENKFKKLAWDYNLSFIYRVNIENHMPQRPQLDNNRLVQCIDEDYQKAHNGKKHPDSGKIGIHLDGVILIDDSLNDMVARTYLMRQYGTGLTAANWDLFEKKLIR